MIPRQEQRHHFRISVAVIAAFAVLVTALSSWGVLLAQDRAPGPTNFSAQKTANGIRLSWTAPEAGADGYRIFAPPPRTWRR